MNRFRLITASAAFAACAAAALAENVTVFAAASLKNALDEIAAGWQAETGNMVAISYGGSPALAKQIQQGAPADLFVSAAENWMDVLQGDGLIQPESRVDLLGNTLVLVAHGNDTGSVQITAGLDLAGLLGGEKLAMAMVDSVPAGQYGKAALVHLGLWDSVAASVVQTENVRAALGLVVSGEARMGIVYGSDAIADDAAGNAVSVAGAFPADSYGPIRYPAALIAGGGKPEAAAFLAYLSSKAAGEIFVAQGFSLLK